MPRLAVWHNHLFTNNTNHPVDISLIAIKALQLICCLSLLVLLHEGGHFFFAKLFGVKVEKFYMFFNPKFHLFSTRDKWFTRLFPYFKDNETEYGIGWIPLGGYVKIAGMVDESMDTEQLKQPARPDEFRSQSIPKRFWIMVGGVLVNVITAFALYAIILFTWGKDILPTRNLPHGLAFNERAEQLGFRDGDTPIRVDGEEIESYSPALLRDFSNAREVTVLRGEQEVNITMPEDGLNMLELLEMNPAFMEINAQAVVDSVVAGQPAARVGISKGDTVVSLNGVPTPTTGDFLSVMEKMKGDEVTVVVNRAGTGAQDTLGVALKADKKLGLYWKNPITEEMFRHIDYGFFQSIPAGIASGWDKLTSYVSDLKYLFSKKGAQSVGSFITIGSIFPNAWDWQMFWNLTAFISIILAVMNILPIPGLDGGHVALLAYEAITGHEPGEKVQVWLEYIGMGLLIALMVLAIGNDLLRFVF